MYSYVLSNNHDLSENNIVRKLKHKSCKSSNIVSVVVYVE